MNQPSVNVNLGPGGPVLIPCPLEPFRSVTFTVRLGKCACGYEQDCAAAERAHADTDGVLGNFRVSHAARCPARPIRVSCSISGKTWEESEVGDVEPIDFDPMKWSWAEGTKVGDACRERWALVKALLGVNPSWTQPGRWFHKPERMVLFSRRDTVYAALADMARAEESARNAQARAVAAFPWSKMKRDWDGDHIGNRRPSEVMLERYVEHLVEQVGVL